MRTVCTECNYYHRHGRCTECNYYYRNGRCTECNYYYHRHGRCTECNYYYHRHGRSRTLGTSGYCQSTLETWKPKKTFQPK